jgi:hypothetical protein
MKTDPKLLPNLEKLIEQICAIYELANDKGVNSIRFMNHYEGGINVCKKDHVKSIIDSSPYTGVSRIGTELQRRVLDEFVPRPGGDMTMTKPLLVLTFTDGIVSSQVILLRKDLNANTLFHRSRARK